MKLKGNKGFTLIELLVVIVIIGILATLVTVALSSAKVKARDAKRISDIKQMQTALELYYNEESTYPPTNALVAGQALVGAVSGKTFMGKVPAGPNSGETYTYNQINGGTSYTLGYVLEKPVNELAAGAAVALPGNINTQCIPNCANKCSGEMDSCGKPTCINPLSSITVSNIVATADTPKTTITVAWTGLLYSNTTYKLEYSQSTNGGSTWSAFANVSGATALATTTYSHTSRTASYQYKYRVTPTVCSSVVGTASSESNVAGCVPVVCGGASGLCPGQSNCGVACATACSTCCRSDNTCGSSWVSYTFTQTWATDNGTSRCNGNIAHTEMTGNAGCTTDLHDETCINCSNPRKNYSYGTNHCGYAWATWDFTCQRCE